MLKVPALSIAFMAVSLTLAFLLPIALMILLRVKKKANFPPFFIGAAVMLVFALIIEALIHQVVFMTSFGKAIQANIYLYALYGGLMAGLFEETGRYVAMKTLLKKYYSNDANALMYGAGHGGFECIALLGLTMVNNLIYSIMINTGSMSMITASLPAEYLPQIESVLTQLTDSSPWIFLLGIVERIFAIAMHMGFSVIVWFGVKNRKFWLYPFAIFLHAVVDGLTVIVSGFGLSNLMVEGIVGLLTVAVVLIAKIVAKGPVAK